MPTRVKAKGKSKLGSAVANVLREHMRNAIGELASDESLWAELDKHLEEQLDESSRCYLQFDVGISNGVRGLVSISEAVQYVEIVPDYDSAGPHGPPYRAHFEELVRQLGGMDRFIEELQALRRRLVAELDGDKWKKPLIE